MKTIQLKSKLGSALLSLAILFGIGLASSSTAQAQWGNDQYSRQQRQYEREQRRRQRQIEREQRRRAREARQNGGYYGNNGGYYGNNGGYYGNNGRRGNDGYGNYGGSFQLRQTALNAGANEGVKEGRKDRERNERFDYTDESIYREATKDYSSRLGDREAYRRYFREAFVNGYTEGYRGY